MARTKTAKTDDSSANLGFGAKLWLATDKLRNNMDAAEYKQVALGLIFLNYKIGLPGPLLRGNPEYFL